jgi:hypothetical protein
VGSNKYNKCPSPGEIVQVHASHDPQSSEIFIVATEMVGL